MTNDQAALIAAAIVCAGTGDHEVTRQADNFREYLQRCDRDYMERTGRRRKDP